MPDISEDNFKELDKIEKEEVILRWFSPYRGYGFVEHPTIKEDIFVHFSVIDRTGSKYLEPGDKMICDIVRKRNGYQVSEIYKIEHAKTLDAEKADIEVLKGQVKWFNPVKGFGFAQAEGKDEDIFIRASVLKQTGVFTLEPNREILMQVRKSHNGLEAIDVKLV